MSEKSLRELFERYWGPQHQFGTRGFSYNSALLETIDTQANQIAALSSRLAALEPQGGFKVGDRVICFRDIPCDDIGKITSIDAGIAQIQWESDGEISPRKLQNLTLVTPAPPSPPTIKSLSDLQVGDWFCMVPPVKWTVHEVNNDEPNIRVRWHLPGVQPPIWLPNCASLAMVKSGHLYRDGQRVEWGVE